MLRWLLETVFNDEFRHHLDRADVAAIAVGGIADERLVNRP